MPIASLLPALGPGPVDLFRFESLSSELGNSYARLIFVRDFLGSLPDRVNSIISSSMIGGPRVENRCLRIERQVRAG